MLEAIAKAENLVISGMKIWMRGYQIRRKPGGVDGKTMLDMIQEDDKNALRQDMLVRAAMKVIEDNAVIKEA